MSKRWLTAQLLRLVVLAGLLLMLNRSWGMVPPLGPLLSPWRGVMALTGTAGLPHNATPAIPGIEAEVSVWYDRRAVPHIYAANSLDGYRALGYVVARDRLFQMELQTRATAGTLTEWAGPRALPLDREMRRLGLANTAEAEFASLAADDRTRRVLEAFAEGVNSLISDLSSQPLPLEYQLLGTAPQPWQPQYALYLIRRMNHTLTFDSRDLRFEQVAGRVGRSAAEALFPIHATIRQPAVGSSADSVSDHPSLPAPEPQQSRIMRLAIEGDAARPTAASNTWVVSPKRSATGAALLAGDPHLAVTLPSVWFEVHLAIRDSFELYGGMMPGLPAVIIGTNGAVAWSLTNNPIDVIDYYREQVDDSERPGATMIEGQPRPVTSRTESYRDRSGTIIATDTLYASFRGPLLRVDQEWLSLRWLGLESSNAIAVLEQAAKADNVTEWREAMQHIRVPSQMASVADTAGNIALQAVGLVPRRASPVHGILDGTTVDNDWQGFWPQDSNPAIVNPSAGYAAAANAEPVDPAEDPRYLGQNWPSPWRVLRINHLLAGSDRVSIEQMQRWQTDPGSSRAEIFLPWFLAAADGSDPRVTRLAKLLEEWDGRYLPEATGPIAFELAMEQLSVKLWDELTDDAGRLIYRPRDYLVVSLLHDDKNPWWDDSNTEVVEGRNQILRAAMAAGLEAGIARFGEPDGRGWRWSSVRRFTIPHLLRLPGLGRRDIEVPGGPSTISPMNLGGNHGASWRMVFELSPDLPGWIIYPGGQAGNPASKYYDDRIPRWARGEMEPILRPRRPDALADSMWLGHMTIAGPR